MGASPDAFADRASRIFADKAPSALTDRAPVSGIGIGHGAASHRFEPPTRPVTFVFDLDPEAATTDESHREPSPVSTHFASRIAVCAGSERWANDPPGWMPPLVLCETFDSFKITRSRTRNPGGPTNEIRRLAGNLATADGKTERSSGSSSKAESEQHLEPRDAGDFVFIEKNLSISSQRPQAKPDEVFGRSRSQKRTQE